MHNVKNITASPSSLIFQMKEKEKVLVIYLVVYDNIDTLSIVQKEC
jgi:hypothetical protein